MGRHQVLVATFALVAGLTVAGPGVGRSAGLGGIAVTTGSAPWISATADFTIDAPLAGGQDKLETVVTVVPVGTTLLLSDVEVGRIRTAQEPCDKTAKGETKDIWGFSDYLFTSWCLVVNGAPLRCAYTYDFGSDIAGVTKGSRWKSVSTPMPVPEPGIAVPSGAKVAVQWSNLSGMGGKCRFYATITGTLIAN